MPEPTDDQTAPADSAAAAASDKPEDGCGAPTAPPPPEEIGGPTGPEPTRFGDWERKGRCIDF
jgi:hypothetical protein